MGNETFYGDGLSHYNKVICNFAEMDGYYVEKTWSVLKSYSATYGGLWVP